MLSSDEDTPLAQKKIVKSAGGTENAAPTATAKSAPSYDSDEEVLLASKIMKKKAAPIESLAGAKEKAGAAKKSATAKEKPPAAAKSKPNTSKGSSSGTERVKKTFDMPGQTRETPSEDDPLRKFYTSLLEQRPGSEMARRWCAMVGLLSKEDAEEWVEDQAKKKAGKSPTKPTARRPASASTKRKTTDSSATEDDFKSAQTSKRKFDTERKPKPKKESKVTAEKKLKKKPDCIEEGWESSDGSDNDELVLKKKQRSKDKSAKGLHAKKSVAKTTTRDVAFEDGGLDGTDSDDDVPLLQRKKAQI